MVSGTKGEVKVLCIFPYEWVPLPEWGSFSFPTAEGCNNSDMLPHQQQHFPKNQCNYFQLMYFSYYNPITDK